MIFAPHILQRKAVGSSHTDEFGRVEAVDTDEWETVCSCRCDDDDTKELTSPNGSVYRSSYHVVCEGAVNLTEGDIIQCIVGDEVRGAGVIGKVKKTNYFSYTEIWL